MRIFINSALVVLAIFLLLTASAFAQQASNPPGDVVAHTFPDDINAYWRPNNDRSSHREDRVLKKGLLAPSAQDRLTYESFLRERKTGLIRLMPRESYDWETYHAKKRIPIRGGGAYYSFANLTHAYGFGNDLALERKVLSVGFGGADYGMLTNLGDRPLEGITLDNSGARFIAQYAPPGRERAARSEFRRFQAGVKIEGVLYRSRLPLEIGATYLLRSIVYRESDVLVAFRTVREDADGSVIIAWKLLKKYPVPEL
jgi:hypothetical protein